MKINQLEIENVKRIKAVKVEPALNGLTIIGGNNGQGKTSVLDSITWALGGDRYRPSRAQRDGSVIHPYIRITMDNGLVVERKGKNSDLKVTDPSGKKAGQQLLNEFIEQLALDLPKFMNSSGKEKAETLLRLIGVGDQVEALEKKETDLYSDRQAVGRIADQKKKYAREQVFYPDAPREPVSPSELIRRQQEILARNGENQRKRNALQQMQAQSEELDRKIAGMEEQLADMKAERKRMASDIEDARKSAEELQDESTAELEADLANIEEINRKVRANLDKDKAEEDARYYERQYNELTGQITEVRERKNAMLDQAELPLPGLSVNDRELVYNGQRWDNMSGADQLKVSTAIVRKLNPKCGFVLMDKLEQMDPSTLEEFGEWLTKEGLQVIATRVSTGDECSVIISDGYIEGQAHPVMEEKKTAWKAGEF